MEIAAFKTRFTEICSNIENTNYGSIIAEFKLVILIQEFILTNVISKDFLITFFEEEMNKEIDYEARRQVLGEISSNIQDAHKYVSILSDYGEDYIYNLFKILNLFISNKKLFNECNE